jgi:hypothetical protein
MTSTTGLTPPLHRRFNEAESLRQIRDRYIGLKKSIPSQVKLLQADDAFLDRCGVYYQRGYKDWHILAAILNFMLHREAERHGLGWTSDDVDRRKKLIDELSTVVLPADEFAGENFELHFRGHALICLRAYGFQPRNRRMKDKVVEKFLRERMRHFDLDIPHAPMFSRPPGDWPNET